MAGELSDFERGLEKGRIDALLLDHTSRLNRINGSVERFSDANEKLSTAVRIGFDALSSEIRTMQEAQRLAAERVTVAADTLATETERRREELAGSRTSGDRIFSRVDRAVAVLLAVAAILVTVYFSMN